MRCHNPRDFPFQFLVLPLCHLPTEKIGFTSFLSYLLISNRVTVTPWKSSLSTPGSVFEVFYTQSGNFNSNLLLFLFNYEMQTRRFLKCRFFFRSSGIWFNSLICFWILSINGFYFNVPEEWKLAVASIACDRKGKRLSDRLCLSDVLFDLHF